MSADSSLELPSAECLRHMGPPETSSSAAGLRHTCSSDDGASSAGESPPRSEGRRKAVDRHRCSARSKWEVAAEGESALNRGSARLAAPAHEQDLRRVGPASERQKLIGSMSTSFVQNVADRVIRLERLKLGADDARRELLEERLDCFNYCWDCVVPVDHRIAHAIGAAQQDIASSLILLEPLSCARAVSKTPRDAAHDAGGHAPLG
jgi:hypothetical protein